jgi:hypothetical protein
MSNGSLPPLPPLAAAVRTSNRITVLLRLSAPPVREESIGRILRLSLLHRLLFRRPHTTGPILLTTMSTPV